MTPAISTPTRQSSQFCIGLTGGIGCGKTTVANLFAARGAAVVDTDHIAHQLTLPNGTAMPAIRHQFGAEFITAAGAMDRAKMRALVFADLAAKMKLEAILHPLIYRQAQDAIQQAHGLYVVLVVPLLIETMRWKAQVSRILVIDCPESLQIQRVMMRNGLSDAEIRAMMSTQASRTARLAAADDIIINDAKITTLEAQIDRLHALYCSLSTQIG